MKKLLRNVVRNNPGLRRKQPEAAVKQWKQSSSSVAPHIDWAYLLDRFYACHFGGMKEKHYGWWVSDEEWKRLKPYGDRRQGHFHPSSGLLPELEGCPRTVMFDLLCSPRSEPSFGPGLARRLDNGVNRHIGLHVAFMGMAAEKFMGVESYIPEQRLSHPHLPIEGSADGIVRMTNGHTYLIDFKTINTRRFKERYTPEQKHTAQVITYLGLAGLTAGYVMYENKDSQEVAGPMDRMRVEFDPNMFRRVEEYCRAILKDLASYKLPEFSEPICKASISFCSYTETCKRHLSEVEVEELDNRPADMKKRHLKVVNNGNREVQAPAKAKLPRRLPASAQRVRKRPG